MQTNSPSMYQDGGSYVELLGSPRVFLHEINTLPMFSNIIATVKEIEKYERVLPIAREQDIVLTKSQPDKDYINWLRSVGLGAGKFIVVKGNPSETLPTLVLKNGLRRTVDQYLGPSKKQASFCPYYGGPLESNAGRHLDLKMYSNTRTVKKYDSKINFKSLCREIGVPVVDDVLLEWPMSYTDYFIQCRLETINNFLSEYGSILVKGEFGASGSTTKASSTFKLQDLQQFCSGFQSNGQFLVEPRLPVSASPSSLWFISKDRSITHIRTSNQLLSETDGLVHTGNEFPVSFNEEKVKSYTFKIAQQFAYEGYIGPFGIDFIELKGTKELFAVECNPRVTGANYPWELVYLLNQKHNDEKPIKAARSENVYLGKKGLKFKDLQRLWHNYLYTGEHPSGVIIPYNVGPVSSGKVTVLATGSVMNEIDEIFLAIKNLARN